MTITYVFLVMRASNDGEGGVVALITLIRRQPAGGRKTSFVLAALGMLGTSLFLGDSMIKPRCWSCRPWRDSRSPRAVLDHLAFPITATIIVVLFLLQRLGTEHVGRLFGPVMVVWFLTIAAGAAWSGIADHPRILKALSPTSRWTSSSTTSRSRSSRWPRSCSRSPAPRRCMRTWGISGALPITRASLFAGVPGMHPELHGPGRPDPRRPDSNVAAPLLLVHGATGPAG